MRESLIILSYQQMVDTFGKRVFKQMRASFFCKRNADVENFIHNECSKYEKDSNTRNYFIFDSLRLEIAAFFTISLHSIILGDLMLKQCIFFVATVNATHVLLVAILLGKLLEMIHMSMKPSLEMKY